MTVRETNSTTRLVVSPDEVRHCVAQARRAGSVIGLVPTMGALHEGHLSLVDAARADCDLTVVSVFVNPAQFGPHEDFSRYPRKLDADFQLLAARGADLVFAPATETIYQPGHATYVEMSGPALPLEGQFRPGHFRGVATIVLKLFHLVEPDRAYFGRKDYQQALVVRRMAADLDLPIAIEVCPIVREPEGLAMSSRNMYLSADERRRALSISRGLQLARQLVAQSTTDAKSIHDRLCELLRAEDLKIDYVALVDPDSLAPVELVDRPTLVAIAAYVGKTRLIDNDTIG